MNSNSVFTCRMCGECCQGQGGIVTGIREQERIAAFFNLTVSQFVRKYLEIRNNKHCIKTRKDDYCIFFDPKDGCAIHPVKPDVCLAWPFFRGNLLDEYSFELAKDYCPGLDPEATHTDFVAQGIYYLRRHGLISGLKTGQANALIFKDLEAWK